MTARERSQRLISSLPDPQAAVVSALDADPEKAWKKAQRIRELLPYVSNYALEFGSAYQDIPSEILDAVASGELVDLSWGNDVSPTFGCVVAQDGHCLTIWVDAVDVEAREMYQPARFAVRWHDAEADIWAGDDVLVALEFWRRELRRFRDGMEG